MKEKLFIRADGNSQIGLGHMVRCSALAYILKDKYEVIFMCREIPSAIEEDLTRNGFIVRRIGSEKDFLDYLETNTIVVLDGYNFGTNYQRQIKAKGSKLVCIDDLHDKKFVADLIINHSPVVNQQDYQAMKYTQFALGLDYALLRSLFLQQSNKKRKIEKIETILICFGGSDPMRLTESTLEVILKYPTFKKITIVTGITYRATENLECLVQSDSRIIWYEALTENELCNALLDSEMAIAPSSTILLEIFTVGLPVITGYYAENQKEVSQFFVKNGLALDIGNMNIDYQNKLSEQVDRIFKIDYKKMIIKQKRMMKSIRPNLLKVIQNI